MESRQTEWEETLSSGRRAQRELWLVVEMGNVRLRKLWEAYVCALLRLAKAPARCSQSMARGVAAGKHIRTAWRLVVWVEKRLVEIEGAHALERAWQRALLQGGWNFWLPCRFSPYELS